jgi:SAM-dependent methyltransferase
MIERARANFGEPPGLRWVVRAFDAPDHPARPSCGWCPARPAEPFDAAICVGNSLALAPDKATVGRAIAQMLAAVRAGGVIVVHVLNLGHLPDGPCVWQKSKRVTLPQGEALILKGVHRCGSRGYVELVVTGLSGGTPLHSEAVPLLGLEAVELEEIAREAGASQVAFFGGYQDQKYEPQKSVDLVMVGDR